MGTKRVTIAYEFTTVVQHTYVLTMSEAQYEELTERVDEESAWVLHDSYLSGYSPATESMGDWEDEEFMIDKVEDLNPEEPLPPEVEAQFQPKQPQPQELDEVERERRVALLRQKLRELDTGSTYWLGSTAETG